jgi:hypothetical protein
MMRADGSSFSTVVGLVAHSMANAVGALWSMMAIKTTSWREEEGVEGAAAAAVVRRALLIFSLAAPVGALVTYAILSLLGGSGGSSS